MSRRNVWSLEFIDEKNRAYLFVHMNFLFRKYSHTKGISMLNDTLISIMIMKQYRTVLVSFSDKKIHVNGLM